MKKRLSRVFHIGPGAASLIMIAVVLSMCVLGVLALTNARNDLQLSQRAAEVVTDTYALNEKAEETAAAVDAVLAVNPCTDVNDETWQASVQAALPAAVKLMDGCISWKENVGTGRALYCSLQVNPQDSGSRYAWVRHQLVADSMGNDSEELYRQADNTFAVLENMLRSIAASAKDQEQYMAQVAENLPARMTLENGIISWMEEGENGTLECSVQLNSMDSGEKCSWLDRNYEEKGFADEWN